MSTITKENDQTFNDAVEGMVFGTDSANAMGEGSTSIRTTGAVTSNRTTSSTIGATSGTGNTVLGSGATLVNSLDAGTVAGALDFGKTAIAGSNSLAQDFLSAFAASQESSQKFQSELVSGFKTITEGTADTLRGALSATLDAPALRTPATTSATISADQTQRLALIGAGLVFAWLVLRPRK